MRLSFSLLEKRWDLGILVYAKVSIDISFYKIYFESRWSEEGDGDFSGVES